MCVRMSSRVNDICFGMMSLLAMALLGPADYEMCVCVDGWVSVYVCVNVWVGTCAFEIASQRKFVLEC